jgi:hypothetical protein
VNFHNGCLHDVHILPFGYPQVIRHLAFPPISNLAYKNLNRLNCLYGHAWIGAGHPEVESVYLGDSQRQAFADPI